jgi:small-conductance mechanosensitive channel
MQDLVASLPSWLTGAAAMNWVRALVLLVLGAGLIRFLSRSAGKAAKARFGAQASLLARRGVSLLGWGLLAATVLNQLGFELSVLMGAAGVVTVAAGFASQTAASNLISGLFLIGEQPFVVGDVITIDGVTGEVTDIDMVSVKLRTFDNLLVRVPNEALLKSRITNVTAYPIRRIDLPVGVAYKEDIERVIKVIRAVVDEIPVCLDEPEMVVIHQGFGESSINLQISVWAAKQNFLQARTRLWIDLKKAFDREGIEIPFPHRTVYTGALTEPMPIRVVSDEEPPTDGEGSSV